MTPKANNGKALASMILGIVSVALCCYWFIALAGGVVALILGIMARKEIAAGNGTNGGMALTGVITGAVAAALGLIFGVLSFTSSSFNIDTWCADNPDNWICQNR
jgi:hypothetical protein